MVKKILIWGSVAFLIFFIAYRPESAGAVFTDINGVIGDIAQGVSDVFTGLIA